MKSSKEALEDRYICITYKSTTRGETQYTINDKKLLHTPKA